MMQNKNEKLRDLVKMSNNLGNLKKDYVILGEGNTSCKIDSKTFYVKSSGSNLRSIVSYEFIEVLFEKILSLLNLKDIESDTLNQIYNSISCLFLQFCV